MEWSHARGLTWLVPTFTLLLPLMLILSAFRTYGALDRQREVHLRSRAAALAAKLETMQPALSRAEWIEALADEDRALVSAAILDRESSPELEAIWDGRELYRTERLRAGGAALYRAFVPFHTAEGLRIARIDLEESAADFLVEHARHHLWLVLAGGVSIIALSLLNARSTRRAIEAEKKQLGLAQLARIGEMSAVLAHEIRNPLGTIKGYAQLLGEKLNGEHGELLSPILSETTRLEALVRDLLLYGRPAEPVARPVDSGELTRLLSHHAQHLAAPLGVEVRISLPAFTLQTDPGLLEQILLNLMRNAIDAAGSKSAHKAEVTVEGIATHNEIVLTVEDSGPGFSPEALQRMFEPFFTTKAMGTGLGLCVSRKLVESLGGSLTAGNSEGGSARLVLRIPVLSSGATV